MFFFEPLADFYLDPGILKWQHSVDDLDHRQRWRQHDLFATSSIIAQMV